MEKNKQKLTTKQRAFVESYLANGFNATQAAIAAGYPEKSASVVGSENLVKPNIAALIEDRMKAMTMTANEALVRLSEQARGTLGDFADADGRINIAAARRANKMHLVKRLSIDNKAGEDKVTIELYDAQAALVHILREQHLIAGEATGRDEIVLMTDDERAKRVADLLDKARDRRARLAAVDQRDGE